MKRRLITLLVAVTLFAGCVKEPSIDALELKQQPQIKTGAKDKLTPEIITHEDGEMTTATIAEGRNLQLYDSGGHYYFERFDPAAARHSQDRTAQKVLQDLEQARGFIWKHWEQKQQGYLRLTFVGTDAAATHHIFIEPDSNGKWVVTRRLVRWHALSPPEVDELPKVYGIERKVTRNERNSLVFSDARGVKLDTL